MKYDFINPKEITPDGWLMRQLRIQADGLHGNLDKVWRDVKESKWLGGNGEGWERLPLFLDGFIPLSLLVGDEDKIARAKKYADCILSCQDEKGRFRPKNDTEPLSDDIWAQFLIMRMLTNYADCLCDDDKAKEIENALLSCFEFIYAYTSERTLFNWAAFRWYECLIAAKWLFGRNISRQNREFIIKVCERLKVQGADICDLVEVWKKNRDKNKGWNYEAHIVNIAMTLKAYDLYGEIMGEKPTATSEEAFSVLYKKHGTAYGHFTGDECLSGLSAIHGSELCGIVEAMYSYEWNTAVTGKSVWGERLENLAFNGLPATVSEDMWTHQYDQQVNQISCKKYKKAIYRTNEPDANVFGLEPNYGCCTANFGQGFPKFALSAYMKQPGGIVAVSPVSMKIQTEIDGEKVNFSCKTEYPFGKTCVFTSDKTIKLKVRVSEYAKIEVCDENNNKIDCVKYGGWVDFVLERGVNTVVKYEYSPRLEKAPEGGYCLRYGALLFAVPVKEKREIVEYEKNGVVRKFPYCDYTLTPDGEWRYAFTKKTAFSVENHPVKVPFSRTNLSVTISAELARVRWNYEKGYDLIASEKPGRIRVGSTERIKMQPYGATNLRIAVMSLLDDEK